MIEKILNGKLSANDIELKLVNSNLSKTGIGNSIEYDLLIQPLNKS